MQGKDLMSRLAEAGEEAIHKLAKVPGGEQVAHAMTNMRDRVDELQKKVRGIDALEARIDELERRVAELSGTPVRGRRRTAAARGGAKTTASRSRARTTSTAKKTSTARKRSTGSSSAGTGGTSPG